MKKLLFLIFVMMLSIYSGVNASPISLFSNPANGWIKFGWDEGVGSNGYVNPGYGGQLFDAEYLFYKFSGGAGGYDTLSIGLQAGFDLLTGKVHYSDGKDYYAGDLALSFDGDSTNFEYAADFGLKTRGYVYDTSQNKYIVKNIGNNSTTGVDAAGLYQVDTWANPYPYVESSPFAMQSGDIVYAFDSTTNLKGSGNSGTYSKPQTSYYRIISFPTYLISEYDATPEFTDVHWTMSCGNDVVNGRFPEPGTMFLLGSLATGLFGFAGLRRRFTK